ncbi:MAG: hypothetical protein OXU20_04100 [Myxococcales bacterium]|nr:hypothetical protein [Myxococcales bacterium]
MIVGYLEQFVLGSCAFAALPWFYAIHHEPKRRYSYYAATMFVPVTMGLWNVLSLFLSEHFGLSLRMRFVTITAINYVVNLLNVGTRGLYVFSLRGWVGYAGRSLLLYAVHWNVVVHWLVVSTARPPPGSPC